MEWKGGGYEMARKEELQDDTRGMTTKEIERTARRTTKWHARRNYETTRKEGLQRGIDEELQNDTQRGTANAMAGGTLQNCMQGGTRH